MSLRKAPLSNVIYGRFTKTLRYRYCSTCGYLMSQREVELMKFDLPCPRCMRIMISDFLRFERIDPEILIDRRDPCQTTTS